MKLEVGMYVRTKGGYIEKIISFKSTISNDYVELEDKYYANKKDILKASHNIIDLIEVGDYVDGEKVIRTNCNVLYYDEDSGNEIDIYNALETTDSWVYFDSEITSIVTKEQFEAMVYKIMN